MPSGARHISRVEAQYDAKRHADQVLALTQLSLDPIWEIEELDAQLARRRRGERPGEHRLLTLRRDVMRRLAAELA
jgi:hypothetical protein